MRTMRLSEIIPTTTKMQKNAKKNQKDLIQTQSYYLFAKDSLTRFKLKKKNLNSIKK